MAGDSQKKFSLDLSEQKDVTARDKFPILLCGNFSDESGTEEE